MSIFFYFIDTLLEYVAENDSETTSEQCETNEGITKAHRPSSVWLSKRAPFSLVRGQTEERLFRPKCPMAIRLLTEPFRAEVTDEIWFGVVLLGQSDAY